MDGIRVAPYAELTFDAEGGVARDELDALVATVTGAGLTDLVVFAHGWNNNRSLARSLYGRFFDPFPEVLAALGGTARLGYAGVIWPSMRFTDERLADLPVLPDGPRAAAPLPAGAGLPAGTLDALAAVLPAHRAALDRIEVLLSRGPGDPTPAELAEFAGLARRLATAPGPADHDLEPPTGPDPLPAVLTEDPHELCTLFTEALTTASAAEGDDALLGGLPGTLWRGALELLRQCSYWEMKRRAGQVGQRGLGPALGVLATAAPDLRVHLVGHSFGARLMSFAVDALPEHARGVRSLTLLQGAFSHYAFTPQLPFATGRGGALRGAPAKVRGPVLCCHSRHDLSLSLLYPLASRISGDDSTLLGLGDRRWGALGHDGVQDVGGTVTLDLAHALAGPLPASGCVNVDVSAVVRRGGPPAGAHSDICHGELARLVLLAGGLVR
ncbi:hypothetical protein GCM10010218_22560 [Streptomyces mashuensis]|uniref:Serine-threonine protein kinase n=1 Tax=Streptomyces mashuensis TaxID=33904 RepID=A0A919ECF5_9ACTN|nr:serine-threonine protein kinase [Streptomyces mashuensis]GHF40658.1 hypothetical protein GCM10010218_22560 [Streptomyces mashuensis]